MKFLVLIIFLLGGCVSNNPSPTTSPVSPVPVAAKQSCTSVIGTSEATNAPYLAIDTPHLRKTYGTEKYLSAPLNNIYLYSQEIIFKYGNIGNDVKFTDNAADLDASLFREYTFTETMVTITTQDLNEVMTVPYRWTQETHESTTITYLEIDTSGCNNYSTTNKNYERFEFCGEPISQEAGDLHNSYATENPSYSSSDNLMTADGGIGAFTVLCENSQ